jgi:hypothetical protein
MNGEEMRRIGNIQILELFVHILDNRAPLLHLSDFPIEFLGNQPLLEYFTSHIQSSLKEPSAKAARFHNINPDQASGICSAILSDQLTLANGSRRLAECLYEIISGDQRISPADLAIALCQDQDNPGNRFLAILKIDPSEVFEHEIIQEANGIRINYHLSDNALTKEKLQKCAFIRPLEPRHAEYDLLLLDRQTGVVGDGVIARFFAERFLDASDAYDALRRTKVLYNTLMGAHNQIRDQLTEVVNQDLDNRILMAVGNRVINTDHWLDELPVDENTRQHFREALQERLPDVEFEIDHQLAETMTRRIHFEGDYGFKISIPSANLRDIIQSEEIITRPDGQVMHKIEILTQTWVKVSR